MQEHKMYNQSVHTYVKFGKVEEKALKWNGVKLIFVSCVGV